jgi:hypothetical protein
VNDAARTTPFLHLAAERLDLFSQFGRELGTLLSIGLQ